jgi:hypothetical protein
MTHDHVVARIPPASALPGNTRAPGAGRGPLAFRHVRCPGLSRARRAAEQHAPARYATQCRAW